MTAYHFFFGLVFIYCCTFDALHGYFGLNPQLQKGDKEIQRPCDSLHDRKHECFRQKTAEDREK